MDKGFELHDLSPVSSFFQHKTQDSMTMGYSGFSVSISNKGLYSHFSEWRRFWEYLVIFVSLMVPIEISFIYVVVPDITIYTYLVFFVPDIFFAIDYYIVQRTVFLHKGKPISDMEQIAIHYGKFRLKIQLISIIPFGWIGILMKNPYWYVILSINKLLRLDRGFHAYSLTSNSLPYMRGKLSILPFFFFFFFAIHTFSIIYLIIARIQGYIISWIAPYALQDHSSLRLYVITVYFVMTTISTIGYGDISPVTTLETIIMIFVQLSGVFLQAVITANMVAVLIDPLESDFVAHYKVAQDFLRFKEVDKLQRQEVRNFSQHQWQKTGGAGGVRSILKVLPVSLRTRIKYELTKEIFERTISFNSLLPKYLLRIADIISHVTFSPGEFICHQGEICDFIVFIDCGIVQILLDNTVVASHSCNDGIVHGETQLLTGTQRSTSIKASTYVTAWILKKSDLVSLLKSRTKLREWVMQAIQVGFPFAFEHILHVLFEDQAHVYLDGFYRKQKIAQTLNQTIKTEKRPSISSISKRFSRDFEGSIPHHNEEQSISSLVSPNDHFEP